MMPSNSVIISILFSALCSVLITGYELRFPPDFKFGASTAAYQIEGAWNVSDKSESIWDRHTHVWRNMIADGSDGDVAANSYNNYLLDVQSAARLGLHHYRFSISWPRLLPDAYPHYISEDGKNYYNNLINALLANNIQPVVTLYHWDLPQKLQDLGGWTNPLIADWFGDYANVAYSLFGDRVKTWITINEPLAVCDVSYNTGILAPNTPDPDRATYICNKNVLLAHAKAWRMYDIYYKPIYGGKVSISNILLWYEGLETEEDNELAELVHQYSTGRYLHPIFSKEGGWPPVIEQHIAERSRKQGYPRSRLPAFTKEEIEFIRGTYDFFAMNYYTSRAVRKAKPYEKIGAFWTGNGVPELQAQLIIRKQWGAWAQTLLPANPVGLRKALNWVNKNYKNQSILITENGFADSVGNLDDLRRINYIRNHLEQLLMAIYEDNVKVTGYTYWALIDNFEWMDGYKSKFGLYDVDYTSPERKRTPRKSAHYYRSIIRNHSLHVPLEPETWAQEYFEIRRMFSVNSAARIKHSIYAYLVPLVIAFMFR